MQHGWGYGGTQRVLNEHYFAFHSHNVENTVFATTAKRPTFSLFFRWILAASINQQVLSQMVTHHNYFGPLATMLKVHSLNT